MPKGHFATPEKPLRKMALLAVLEINRRRLAA